MPFFIAVLFILLGTEVISILALQRLSVGSKPRLNRIGWIAYFAWTVFILASIFFIIFNRDKFSNPRFMNTAFTFGGFWMMNFVLKMTITLFFLLNQARTTSIYHKNRIGCCKYSICWFVVWYGQG